jgi:site-specific DNA-cytosine methylase
MRPLALDLCCGMGGWTDGLLTVRFDVVGVNIYRHPKYRCELELCDLMQFDESRFSGVALVVASPPCDEYARWDKPEAWFTQGRPIPNDSLVNRCREIAANLGAPLVLENVRGAQRWIGFAVHHYGPFYLWGDGVPPLLPRCDRRTAKFKNSGWDAASRARIPFGLAAAVADFHAGRIAAGEPFRVPGQFNGYGHETRVSRSQLKRRLESVSA